MRILLASLLAALGLAASFEITLVYGQTQSLNFNPENPFANILSAEQWTGMFATGAPTVDPNDRFRNLTSREWTETGEWQTREQEGLSTEAFLATFNGSGGERHSLQAIRLIALRTRWCERF